MPAFIKKFVIKMSAVDSLGLKTVANEGEKKKTAVSTAVVSEDEED